MLGQFAAVLCTRWLMSLAPTSIWLSAGYTHRVEVDVLARLLPQRADEGVADLAGAGRFQAAACEDHLDVGAGGGDAVGTECVVTAGPTSSAAAVSAVAAAATTNLTELATGSRR